MAGPSFVKKIGAASAAGSGTSLAITVTAAPASGSTVIGVGRIGAGVRITSVTDSKGNSWGVDFGGLGSASNVFVIRAAMASALAVNDTVTITSGSSANRAFALFEFSNFPSAPLIDTVDWLTNSTTAIPATAPTPPLWLPAVPDELVIAGVVTGLATGTWTPPSGFTDMASATGIELTDAAYLVASARQAVGGTWAWSTGSQNNAEVLIAYRQTQRQPSRLLCRPARLGRRA
jgi:hypothetical protein